MRIENVKIEWRRKDIFIGSIRVKQMKEERIDVIRKNLKDKGMKQKEQ